MGPLLWSGGKIVFLDKFDPKEFLKELENYRVTISKPRTLCIFVRKSILRPDSQSTITIFFYQTSGVAFYDIAQG